MNIAVLVPFFLVLLGFAWGVWLIFRKGDLVAQPAKMLGYFVGALIAFFVASFLAVVIFPGWANQLLGMATTSSSVQSFQLKTEQLFQQSFGVPTATSPAPAPGPTPTGRVSPLSLPGGGKAIVHVVQGGETLYSISRKYKVTVQSIKTLNNIPDSSNRINIGDRLMIPQP
jgi:LysM repeat protein